jgi:hypothetical protein
MMAFGLADSKNVKFRKQQSLINYKLEGLEAFSIFFLLFQNLHMLL